MNIPDEDRICDNCAHSGFCYDLTYDAMLDVCFHDRDELGAEYCSTVVKDMEPCERFKADEEYLRGGR